MGKKEDDPENPRGKRFNTYTQMERRARHATRRPAERSKSRGNDIVAKKESDSLGLNRI